MKSWVINQDVMDWDAFPEYDMLYTDPPWSDGNVKYFETIMLKQTGIEAPKHSHRELYTHLFTLADTALPMLVEFSIKGYEPMVELAESLGHSLNAISSATYGARPNKSLIMQFNTSHRIEDNLHGAALVSAAMQLHQPEVVFDPFAGIGFTANIVIKEGFTYTGSELNPARYERAAKVIGRWNKKNGYA